MSRIQGLRSVDRGTGAVLVLLAFLAPLIFNDYWVRTLLTQMLFLGVVAASLIFLSAFGGMVSLAQVALYGIAGFTMANLSAAGTGSGLREGWAPLAAVPVAILVTVAIGLLFGALANRSVGIYFLMITLTFSVIANLFFGQVTSLSGFGGIGGVPRPSFISTPERLYYMCLAVAVVVYLLLRYLSRTPFGLTLQGIRDDPVRMASLGYNVALHRTLAFGVAAFVAALGGILFVWWNRQISPSTIGLSATINVLVIAVIGGLLRLEGAWLRALVFVLLNNYTQQIGAIADRFQTVIGVVFLVIVLVSPDGLMGLWGRLLGLRQGVRDRRAARDSGRGSGELTPTGG